MLVRCRCDLLLGGDHMDPISLIMELDAHIKSGALNAIQSPVGWVISGRKVDPTAHHRSPLSNTRILSPAQKMRKAHHQRLCRSWKLITTLQNSKNIPMTRILLCRGGPSGHRHSGLDACTCRWEILRHRPFSWD